jgi:predicted transcriptional regulator
MRELTIEEDDYLALNTSYLVDYSNTMYELQTLKDAYAEINSLNITAADKEAKQQELISEIQSKLLEGNELLNTMDENRVSNLESIVEAYE